MNINYNWDDTRLTQQVNERANEFHPFFNSIPEALNDSVLLKYQQSYINKILKHSLEFPHILYCVTNEIQHAQSKYWSWYWSNYVKHVAKKESCDVELTKMHWAPDMKDNQHKLSLDHPDVYTFFESSQNSAISGQENWDNLQYVRGYLSGHPRPINAVKVYGKTGNVTWPGTDAEAVDRFWRNILGGCAGTRFHRNENGMYGLGICEITINSIRAVQLFMEDIKPWHAIPANGLLLERSENEAYLITDQGKCYAVYFPKSGEVKIDLIEYGSPFKVRWINIWEGTAMKSEVVHGGPPPDQKGKWVVTLIKE